MHPSEFAQIKPETGAHERQKNLIFIQETGGRFKIKLLRFT
ncbi:hypothetical protein GPEL0_01r1442 [Geoanaerobacter pelophilus]|uniref:Uncharacterized protein n=1 Tax=Geoanaerobacter pelophilus TaxID=60036 RepID=A0ABQ0MGG4_9BACT|nr:hypothetical protein GPEL0_01r1442 [Geoanaerobacter pelophilus]